MTFISATEPDWSREKPRGFWDPGRKLLKAIRDYQRFQSSGGGLLGLRRKFVMMRHRFWSAISNCDIQPNTEIGGGLLLPHPNGIVINSGAKIGPNCMIMQQVTLGSAEGKGGAPIVEGHVDIGPGAKILGPVKVGDHAQIGANAVVLKDVPERTVAVGVPARIIPQKSRKSVPPVER